MMMTGYHAVYAGGYFDGIDVAKDNGFEFVQFDLGVPGFFLDGLSDDELRRIRDYAGHRDMRITFHAPGDNLGFFCDFPLIRAGIREQFKLILRKANMLGARHITIHPGSYSQFRKTGEQREDVCSPYYEQVFYDNVKYLTDNCGGVLVCVENFGWDATARRAIQKLMDEGNPLFLTLDIAKLYSGDSKIKQADYGFFLRNRARIREMHVHDKNSLGQHQTVGTGDIDFKPFQAFVNEDVYVNFEVRPVGAAKESKDNLLLIWDHLAERTDWVDELTRLLAGDAPDIDIKQFKSDRLWEKYENLK